VTLNDDVRAYSEGDRERLQRGQQKEWAQQQMGERQARRDQER
jgi:hypothetical protein